MTRCRLTGLVIAALLLVGCGGESSLSIRNCDVVHVEQASLRIASVLVDGEPVVIDPAYTTGFEEIRLTGHGRSGVELAVVVLGGWHLGWYTPVSELSGPDHRLSVHGCITITLLDGTYAYAKERTHAGPFPPHAGVSPRLTLDRLAGTVVITYERDGHAYVETWLAE